VSERVGLDAAELRRQFDESFAVPPLQRDGDVAALLLLSLGGQGYALELAEVAALAAERTIARVPSRVPEVLGLAALRGNVFPVYDLQALLGHGAAGAQPRWLAVVRGPEPLALGFDGFERYHELPRAEVRAATSSGDGGAYVRALVRASDRLWGVLDLGALAGALRQRMDKER
jgi:chemotaxis signal transduction protein